MVAVKHEWASSRESAPRRGAGHSRLTAGHRRRTCTTVARAILSASKPGEEGSSPGTPTSPPVLRSLPATLRGAGCPHHKGGGHPDAAPAPEKRPTRGTTAGPGSLTGGSKSERPVTTARWIRGKARKGRRRPPVGPSRNLGADATASSYRHAAIVVARAACGAWECPSRAHGPTGARW